jgi:hypothetical protein
VPCTDPGFEPNESESSATDLGAYTDCDGTGTSISAMLDGDSDVDFYFFDGTDESGCLVDPTGITGAGVRLCLFATCPGASVSCSAGQSATSPGGHAGCCTPSGGTVTLDVNCSGLSDDSTVYIRVDQPTTNACTPYSVDFHY